jgi:hypothetical protein
VKLIEDAATVARGAWSMRMIYASVVLGAVDVAMPFFAPEQPSGIFGVLSVLVGIAAGVARVVSQPGLHK